MGRQLIGRARMSPAKDMHPAHVARRRDHPKLGIQHRAGLKGVVPRHPEQLAISGMNHRDEAVVAALEHGAVRAEHLVKLVRPPEPARLQVNLPVGQAGQALRILQLFLNCPAVRQLGFKGRAIELQRPGHQVEPRGDPGQLATVLRQPGRQARIHLAIF